MMTTPVHFIDRHAWRGWLSANHASEKIVWMLFYKKHTAQQCISYDEAVEEAICFGWIDSIIKRIDDAAYMQKFTPRNPKSEWSDVNIVRLKKCIDENRMEAAGFAVITNINALLTRPLKAKKQFVVPEYITAALANSECAITAFQALSTSEKKRYCGWIDSAVRVETKMKRVAEVQDLLEKGQRLGMK